MAQWAILCLKSLLSLVFGQLEKLLCRTGHRPINTGSTILRPHTLPSSRIIWPWLVWLWRSWACRLFAILVECGGILFKECEDVEHFLPFGGTLTWRSKTLFSEAADSLPLWRDWYHIDTNKKEWIFQPWRSHVVSSTLAKCHFRTPTQCPTCDSVPWDRRFPLILVISRHSRRKLSFPRVL